MNKSFYINRPLDYNYTEDEFNHVLDDFKEMIGIFIYLINAIKDNSIKDEDWRYYAETLAIKFVLCANTMTEIIKGSEISSNLSNVNTNIIDVSSLYILKRSQIENYLTYFYLFVQPKTIEEQRFRFNIFKLSGYRSRQRFKPLTIYTAKKQEEEKKLIEKILDELKNDENFNSLEKWQQNNILDKNSAKLYSWNKLLEDSDLYNEIFRKSWYLYSNFTHSEFASLMQIKEFLKVPRDTISIRNLIQLDAIMLISRFIKNFCRLYKEIEIRYNLVPINDQNVIDFFNKMANNE